MKSRSSGFTLIEVLISLAITVMILTGAFMTFSNLITGLESLRAATATTHSLNRTWMFVARDVRQFVSRPIRNELGELESALWGGELAEDSLNLTRTGWHNGRQQPRGNLERVRYLLEEGVLYRESYAVLDRTDVNEPRRVALLDRVERFEMRFLDPKTPIQPGVEWELDEWPTNWGVSQRESGLVAPPLAIAFILEVEGIGEISRLLEVPGV
jgi:general secretion pathway protein J